MNLAEALRYQQELDEAQRPAYGNPNLAAQGRNANIAERSRSFPFMQAADAQFQKEKSSLSNRGAVTDLINKGFIAGLGGAPVDLINMGLTPLGMGSAFPFGGSEHIKRAMEDYGVATPTERPIFEGIASLTPPRAVMGAARFAGQGAGAVGRAAAEIANAEMVGRAGLSGQRGAVNTNGLPNLGRDLIRSKADELSNMLNKQGFQTDVKHSGSAAGPSSYINVYDPQTGRYVIDPARISGHSKGAFNSQFVHEISDDPQTMQNFVNLAMEMRALGPTELMRQQPAMEQAAIAMRYKNAQKKIAKGKPLTKSEQEAIDLLGGQGAEAVGRAAAEIADAEMVGRAGLSGQGGAITFAKTGSVPKSIKNQEINNLKSAWRNSDLLRFGNPNATAAFVRGNLNMSIKELSDGNLLLEHLPSWGSIEKPFYMIGNDVGELVKSAIPRIERSNKSVDAAKKLKFDNSLLGKLTAEYGDVFSTAKSGRSESNYITHEPSGIKIRISEHNLPFGYVQPDVDLRIGQSLDEQLAEIRKVLGQ